MRLVLSSLIVIAGLLSSQATVATAPVQTASADIRDSGFVYCVSGQVNTFNPQKASSGLIVDTLAAQLYDRLLDVDPYTYRLVPELAESWEVLDNGQRTAFTCAAMSLFKKPPGLRRPENSMQMMSSLPFSGFSIVSIRGITSTAVISPTLTAYSSLTM
ncbi:peptide ABC transporter substrate-binding protein [Salmonella enterica subsp. arizonae]|nr:peptide ABC transporter substrate-binding protein [Salmonella enterica subsp. arizonae]